MKQAYFYFKRIWLYIFKRSHLVELTYKKPYLGQILKSKLTLDDTDYTFQYLGNGIWYSKEKPVKPIMFETLYIN